MPFIKFHPKFELRGLHELLWAEGNSFSCLRDGVYVISESDRAMLDAKGIQYELLNNGMLERNGNRPSPSKQLRKRAASP